MTVEDRNVNGCNASSFDWPPGAGGVIHVNNVGAFHDDVGVKGEFDGVVNHLFMQHAEEDKNYLKSRKPPHDEHLDEKIKALVNSGKLSPFENPDHLIRLLAMQLGQFVGTRGSKSLIDGFGVVTISYQKTSWCVEHLLY